MCLPSASSTMQARRTFWCIYHTQQKAWHFIPLSGVDLLRQVSGHGLRCAPQRERVDVHLPHIVLRKDCCQVVFKGGNIVQVKLGLQGSCMSVTRFKACMLRHQVLKMAPLPVRFCSRVHPRIPGTDLQASTSRHNPWLTLHQSSTADDSAWLKKDLCAPQ